MFAILTSISIIMPTAAKCEIDNSQRTPSGKTSVINGRDRRRVSEPARRRRWRCPKCIYGARARNAANLRLSYLCNPLSLSLSRGKTKSAKGEPPRSRRQARQIRAGEKFLATALTHFVSLSHRNLAFFPSIFFSLLSGRDPVTN